VSIIEVEHVRQDAVGERRADSPEAAPVEQRRRLVARVNRERVVERYVGGRCGASRDADRGEVREQGSGAAAHAFRDIVNRQSPDERNRLAVCSDRPADRVRLLDAPGLLP
jgi:hypothetical protein